MKFQISGVWVQIPPVSPFSLCQKGGMDDDYHNLGTGTAIDEEDLMSIR
jgi:hypothetical protein